MHVYTYYTQIRGVQLCKEDKNPTDWRFKQRKSVTHIRHRLWVCNNMHCHENAVTAVRSWAAKFAKWKTKPISKHRRLENRASSGMHYASHFTLGLVKWIFGLTSYKCHWVKIPEAVKRRNSSQVDVDSQVRILNIHFLQNY